MAQNFRVTLKLLKEEHLPMAKTPPGDMHRTSVQNVRI